MKRRRALQAFAGLGASSILTRPDFRPLDRSAPRPPTRGDGQVVDLVLRDAAAWLDGPDGVPEVVHGVSEGGRVARAIWSRLEQEGWFDSP